MRYAHLFFFFFSCLVRRSLFFFFCVCVCVFFLSSPRRERKAFSPAASRKRKEKKKNHRVLKLEIGFAYLRHLLRLVCKEEKHKSGDNFKCQLRSYLCFRSRTKRRNKTVMSCFSNLSRSVDVRRTKKKKKRRNHKANKKAKVRSSAPLQSDSFMNEVRLHACSQVPRHHHGIFIFSSYLVLFLFETEYVHYSFSFFFFFISLISQNFHRLFCCWCLSSSRTVTLLFFLSFPFFFFYS